MVISFLSVSSLLLISFKEEEMRRECYNSLILFSHIFSREVGHKNCISNLQKQNTVQIEFWGFFSETYFSLMNLQCGKNVRTECICETFTVKLPFPHGNMSISTNSALLRLRRNRFCSNIIHPSVHVLFYTNCADCIHLRCCRVEHVCMSEVL